jgi:hypothetical protein
MPDHINISRRGTLSRPPWITAGLRRPCVPNQMRRTMLRQIRRSLLVLPLLVAFSCTSVGDTPVTPERGAGESLVEVVATTVDTTLESGTALLGETAGVLTIGSHSLAVPEGALDGDTEISGAEIEDGIGITFGPAGTVFNEDALPLLTLSLEASGLTEADEAVIAYRLEDGSLEEVPGSVVDWEAQAIEVHIRHFSTYVVATR